MTCSHSVPLKIVWQYKERSDSRSVFFWGEWDDPFNMDKAGTRGRTNCAIECRYSAVPEAALPVTLCCLNMIVQQIHRLRLLQSVLIRRFLSL